MYHIKIKVNFKGPTVPVPAKLSLWHYVVVRVEGGGRQWDPLLKVSLSGYYAIPPSVREGPNQDFREGERQQCSASFEEMGISKLSTTATIPIITFLVISTPKRP